MQHQPDLSEPQTDLYQLFVLRVWRDQSDGPRRYMLKAADTGQRHIFADPQGLIKFLDQITEERL